MVETEDEFKGWPGLRWHLDDDRAAIAVPIRRKLARDHLYWHGPGVLGLYYEAASLRPARYRLAWWRKRLLSVGANVVGVLPGEADGIIYFTPSNLLPSEFIRCAAKGNAKNLKKGKHT